MRTFILATDTVTHSEFVDRWERLYDYKLDELYADNIGKPLTPERVRQLFTWKNGGRLSYGKAKSVTKNYVDRLSELPTLDPNMSSETFLSLFDEGGAIWRIFWLHMWAPSRFPIYDQHVHRCMTWIQNGRGVEIPRNDTAKIRSYIDNYVPFYARFTGIDPRRVDKALWACGKCMKVLRHAPFG